MKPWQKYYPLTDKNAFICLVDHMGDDSSIVQAARVSYGKDGKSAKQLRLQLLSEHFGVSIQAYDILEPGGIQVIITEESGGRYFYEETNLERQLWRDIAPQLAKAHTEDRNLIRYLMNHSHTTPFEMVEIKFMVQVPMDCWRQWVRHRTASINEYSTRYTEALDFFQVTDPNEWRLQATDNKQGSSGFLKADRHGPTNTKDTIGVFLSEQEEQLQKAATTVYRNRLQAGVAKEQARKDLPLSTYTRAYWKCDLHNIFNFLRLRMDNHAQLEIRQFANCMFEIVKQICPVACEAFEDYVLHAKKFSRMEMEILKGIASDHISDLEGVDRFKLGTKPDSMTNREWKEFLAKLS